MARNGLSFLCCKCLTKIQIAGPVFYALSPAVTWKVNCQSESPLVFGAKSCRNPKRDMPGGMSPSAIHDATA
jgi:hypothetical protein